MTAVENSNRTHQSIYVSDALTSLFHSTPAQFMALLKRDGNKFLRFYWEQVGKKLPAGQPARSDFGLNYDLRRPAANVTVALVTLPKPSSPGEAYFTAMIYRPKRVLPFLRVQDATTLLALELDSSEADVLSTQMVEWDRRIHRTPLGPGPAPYLEDFYTEVLKSIK